MYHYIETTLKVSSDDPHKAMWSERAGIDLDEDGCLRVRVSGRQFDRVEKFLQAKGVSYQVKYRKPAIAEERDGTQREATAAERRSGMVAVLGPS